MPMAEPVMTTTFPVKSQLMFPKSSSLLGRVAGDPVDRPLQAYVSSVVMSMLSRMLRATGQ
jgi:hypothetical protein